MTSNQDPKQNKLSIPMTGIEVMNHLSLDAKQMFHLVRQGVLLPYYPKELIRLNLEMNSIYDSPEITLSRWTYQKSDVEEFKLKHKGFWEELRQQKAAALAESQKESLPKQKYLSEIGKKGGEKSKINRPILYAVVTYMEETPKTQRWTNGEIAKRFCKKYKQSESVINPDDGTEWEISSDGEYIFSKGCGLRSTEIKSIKFSTLRNNYIPIAKKSFASVSDKSPS